MANIVYAGQNLTSAFSSRYTTTGWTDDENITLGQFNKGNGGSDRYMMVEGPHWTDSSSAAYTLWSNTNSTRNVYYSSIRQFIAGDQYTPDVNIQYGDNNFLIRNNTPNSTLTVNFSYSYRRVTTDPIQFQLRKDFVAQQTWTPSTTEVPSGTNVIQVTSNNFTIVNTGSPVAQSWGLFSSVTSGSSTDYIASRWFRCNFVSLV
jgi:hypothetical protein